jgi:hypothetical protein
MSALKIHQQPGNISFKKQAAPILGRSSTAQYKTRDTSGSAVRKTVSIYQISTQQLLTAASYKMLGTGTYTAQNTHI